MMREAYFTTSWDDGHPADLRVAEMLARHGLGGTFYVPRAIDTGVMSPAQVQQLSRGGFEIGAHTLNHVLLPTVGDDVARAEIDGSKKWVEDMTGAPCRMFCPPGGKLRARHRPMIARSGFVGMRSVELISVDPPRPHSAGVMEMPTTIQAFPHSRVAYARNFARRAAARNLSLYLLHGLTYGGEWWRLARRLIERAARVGGVFHLWGHSWELEQTGQWDRLDEVLACMADHVRAGVRSASNGQICESARAAAPADPPPQLWSNAVGGVK